MIARDQVIRAFLDKLAEFGVTLSDPTRIKLDGQWHRAHVDGDRRGTLNLSYKIFYDDRPAGFFEDHKRGFSGTFSVTNGEDMDPAAREAARRAWARRQAEREAEQERAYAEAAKTAQARFQAAIGDPAMIAAHPYLSRKALAPTAGVRVDAEGLLLVPVYTDFKVMSSLQTIAADGEKLFMPGGRMAGAYHPIVGPDKRRVLVCEGYATGNALNAATSHPVACAMSAGNLPAIVRKMQAKFPDAEIVAMVDNDHGTQARTGRNPGVEAGEASGVRVLAPAFPADADPVHTDWDDWLRHYGTASELRAMLDGEAPEPTAEPAPEPVPEPGPPPAEPEPAITPEDAGWPDPINLLGAFEPPMIRDEWMPAQLVPFVRDQADLLGCDPSILALSCIVACAATIHDGIEIQPKRHDPTWTEQARLWGAIVGDPSTRKSPAVKKATSHLRKIDMQLAEQSEGRMADYERELKVYKKREAAWINADAKGEIAGSAPEPPEPPARERLLAEDITIEAMSNVLKDNARGVLVISDELSGWFGSMDAYKGAGGKDRGLWLEIYNGGPKRVDRVMRGTLLVPNWSASILGGIQPEAIRKVSAQLYDDGLLQRFMVVCGRGLNNASQDRVPDMQAIEQYRTLLDTLFATQPGNTPVTLAPGAHEWRERMSAFSHGLAQADMLTPSFRSHLGKWDGLFARLLLVFHCIEARSNRKHPSSVSASEATAKRVHDFMRYFLFPHAAAFYMGVMARSDRDSAVEWIADWILADRREEVSLREIMQSYKRWRAMPEWQQQQVMRSLEDAGWLMPLGEGRRPNRWMVNPKAHALFSEQAATARQRKSQSRERVRDALSPFRG